MARSTRRDDRPGPESEGGRVVALLILGLALLAGLGYVGAYVAAGDKIPVGTRVAGVDIGGNTPTTAVTVLRDGLAGRARTPFTVVVNGRTVRVRPQQVGLDVDYDASVHAAGAGRSWSPSRLWAYYTGGDDLKPVVVLDQTRLVSLVRRLDAADGNPPTDGSVVFHRDGFVVSPPQPGVAVDLQAAGSAFWSAYLSDDPSVQLSLAETPPVVGAGAVRRFVRTFANPAMAAPVTLHLGHATVRLQPATYGRFLGAVKAGHRLRPTVRAKQLGRVVLRRVGAGGAVDAPRDATVALVDGRPQVVGARRGLVFAPHDVAAALMTAIGNAGRTARVRPTRAPASFTDADAKALGITRQVSTSSARTTTVTPALTSAVARLNGTVVKPGDSLSLRGVLGSDVPSGHAATALATATFGASWLGGLRPDSHATLTAYTGDFPMGRDATLAHGQDLTVTDTSPYGVLVAAAVHGDRVTVTLWSTPRWTIRSTHGTPANVTRADRVVRTGQHCRARSGRPGFDVTVTRTFERIGSGTADHSTSYDVHYSPLAAVVCRARHHHHHHHH